VVVNLFVQAKKKRGRMRKFTCESPTGVEIHATATAKQFRDWGELRRDSGELSQTGRADFLIADVVNIGRCKFSRDRSGYHQELKWRESNVTDA